jgi:hypothetical protein
MIFGRITNPEQAGKYFAKINDVVVKGCGAKTLSVDYKTDVREGYDGPVYCAHTIPKQKGSTRLL